LIRIIEYLKMPLTKTFPRPARTGMHQKLTAPIGKKTTTSISSLKLNECKYKLETESGKIIDPIALACWMYEHGKKDSSMFYIAKHQTPEYNILESLTPEYHKTAQKIRDYYSQKFLMLGLRSEVYSTPRDKLGEPGLTKFRTELMRYFLDSKENYEYTDDQVGMIYSLPRLYKEDQLLDKLREKYNTSDWKNKEPHSKVVRKTLYYIDVNRKKNWHHTRATRYMKNEEFFNYWFHDENDRLYCIDLEMNNPFRCMWSRLIEFPLEVEGTIYKNTAKDKLNYYTFGNWEILEEF